MKLHTLVCCLLVACGGSSKQVVKPTPDPIPATAGPSCKDVTAHLATLADRDPAQDAKANDALRARCETDKWSDEARNCLGTASSDGEVDGCKSKLTSQQAGAFPAPAAKAMDATSTGADPWGGSGGGGANDKDKGTRKKKTRGYEKKGKGADSDPCEGGE
jgi:hypothetical protein